MKTGKFSDFMRAIEEEAKQEGTEAVEELEAFRTHINQTVWPNGKLRDYLTGTYLRPATVEEKQASIKAERLDNGKGVIMVNGKTCFVI